jgi:hypothetical protein
LHSCDNESYAPDMRFWEYSTLTFRWMIFSLT